MLAIKVLLVQQKHGINFRVLNEIKYEESCIHFFAITTEPQFIMDYFLPGSGVDVALIQSSLKLASGQYLYEDICRQREESEKEIPIILLGDALSEVLLPKDSKLPKGIFMSIPLQRNDSITELVEMDNRLRQSIIYTGNTYRRLNQQKPCCNEHNDKIFHLLRSKGFPSQRYLDKNPAKKRVPDLLALGAGFPPLPKLKRPMLLAIGVSTGGPEALKILFRDLPENFPAPILLVQHINANFVLPFLENMNLYSKLHFEPGEHGQICRPGVVYMSPMAAHLAIQKHRENIQLLISSKPERQNGHLPSVGFLFDSIAQSDVASSTVALIMTGMGEDGAVEIGKIKDAGGIALAQDEESSSIFGMPKIAIQLGNVHCAVPLRLMAKVLQKLFRVS